MGKEEVDGQMTEQVSAETWFSSMAWTSVGALTELSKKATLSKSAVHFSESICYQSQKAWWGEEGRDGERMGKTEGRESQMGIGLTWAAPAAAGGRPP